MRRSSNCLGEQARLTVARIRSIHPGLFTDEAFASLSMPARVLLLGLWTEADDQGIFDWKPITIKMRIMPVDNVDVPALMAELERADVIRKFDQDSKPLGAIRNFCKYQKPKTPKYRPLKSADLRKYVASTYPRSEDTAPEPAPFPQNGEMSSQMEEGGGKREEEGESFSSASQPCEDEFEEFKASYPRRKGPEGWKAAEQKFRSLVKTGVPGKTIIAAARRLCDELRLKIGTEFVPKPEKWLASEDFSAIAIAVFAGDTKLTWDDALSAFVRTGQWSRYAPANNIEEAPLELLAKHGLNSMGRRVQ